MSIERCSFILVHEGHVRSVKQYCFVRKYAAVPVQIEIVVLQYIGWCVLMVWTFVFNQVSCFCQCNSRLYPVFIVFNLVII